MKYEEFIIESGATVADAMKKLQATGHRILFVAPEYRLEAVITDGDIRRYMLEGRDLNANVSSAATKNPVRVEGFHEGAARRLVEEMDIGCCPMVDEDGLIHALVFRDFTVQRERSAIHAPVIMMAGGLGTRLYPYTEILPKPLIPVGSITITEHILNRFKKFGCDSFTLVVNHKKNLIKSYFSETDVEISFVDETKPLGTGGGLSFFKGKFHEPVFVTNCDSVIEADYAKILKSHLDTKSAVTMVCAKKRIEIPYGVVETDKTGAMTALKEKPAFEYLTNTGFYIVSPEFIELIPNDTFTPITETIERCRRDGLRVNVYKIEEECFVDIGQLEDLKAVEGKLR